MTKILLVRHGETEFNIQEKIQGWSDSPLTERGVQDLKRLAEHLEDFSSVYCSTSFRTVLSAAILCKIKHYAGDVQTVQKLKEINLKPWEGRPIASLSEFDFPADYVTYKGMPHKFQPVGGESLQDVQQRTLSAIREIAVRHEDQTILVVGHGGAISTLVNYFTDNDLRNVWKKDIQPASLTELYFDNGEFIRFGKIGFKPSL